jgi:hypothetical protein
MTARSFDQTIRTASCCLALAIGLTALTIGKAAAVPSFSDQTGQPCASCHLGGFGPQLTPFGRAFKLSGYTTRSVEFSVPVSAITAFSYVHTAADQPEPPAPHYGTNDNFTLDEAALFVAGGIGDHFGGFAQFNYDGVGRSVAWDMLDLRATDKVTFAGTDVLIGLTLTNNPSLSDPWNTLPGWAFSFTDTDLAPAPATSTVIDGALELNVLGLSAYAWWDSHIYTEVALYWTPSRGFLSAMGTNTDESGILGGSAPYVRLAYQRDYSEQNFEIGAFGFFPDLYPGGDRSAGTTDMFRDLGVDASYQYMGDGKNIYQVNARYTNEQQNLDATFLLGGAAKRHDTLNEFRVDSSYYWHNQVGGSVGYFDTWGSKDSLLYGDNASLKPDSEGFILQANYTPFGDEPSSLGLRFSMRMGIQYTLYTRFNGASTNYDGLDHNASDNNTIRVFALIAY